MVPEREERRGVTGERLRELKGDPPPLETPPLATPPSEVPIWQGSSGSRILYRVLCVVTRMAGLTVVIFVSIVGEANLWSAVWMEWSSYQVR